MPPVFNLRMQGPFVIRLSKLQDGLNHLEFKLDNSFFEGRDYARIQECDGQVLVDIDKGDHTHKIRISVSASVKLSCDRCSEWIFIPLTSAHEMVVKQTETSVDYDDDDIIGLTRQQNEFDLAPAIYDLLHIAIPLRVDCEVPGAEKKCDEELLARLEQPEGDAGDESDPRWEQLRKIKEQKP